MAGNSWWESIRRGALGGLVGNILGAGFWWPFYGFHYGSGTQVSYYLFFIVVYSPIAAVVGAAIAVIIRWIDRGTKRDVGIIAGAAVGAGFAGVLGVIASYALYTSVDRAYLGLSYTMFYAKYGLILGAVAGVAIGLQGRRV